MELPERTHKCNAILALLNYCFLILSTNALPLKTST